LSDIARRAKSEAPDVVRCGVGPCDGAGLVRLLVSVALVVLASVAWAEPPNPTAEAPAKKPQPKPVTKIAFFQLEAQVIDPKIAGIISDMLVGELSRMKEAKVIGSKEIDAMLGYEQKKQMSGCTDTSCMVAIGGALGVDKILMGSVGKIGTSYTISLKLINIREGNVEEIFSKRMKGASEEDFLDVIPEALATVFPAEAGTWVKTQKGRTAGQPAPIRVLDLQRTPGPIKALDGSEVRKETAAPESRGAGDRGHSGQFLISGKGVSSLLEKGAAAEVGLGFGAGNWVQPEVAVLVSKVFAVKPRVGVFVYNPDGAVKPFVAAVVPVYFTPDGTMVGAGGGPGVQWDLARWLGLTAEAAAERYFSAPAGYKKLQLFGLAGVQVRI